MNEVYNKQIEEWSKFEQDNKVSIRQLAKEYLEEIDQSAHRHFGARAASTLYDFEYFISGKVSGYRNQNELRKIFGKEAFCLHYGIVVFPLKNYKSLRAESYPNAYHSAKVMETISHLLDKAEYMRSLGKISIMHDINDILMSNKDHGAEVYDIPPIPDATAQETGEFIKEALRALSHEHPAITARLFNEASLKAGFNKHVKRNDVMVLVDNFLA